MMKTRYIKAFHLSAFLPNAEQTDFAQAGLPPTEYDNSKIDCATCVPITQVAQTVLNSQTSIALS
ncbi:MAG: hypothetical protein WBA93_07745 [Microcoleaceae cyanobacterium]